MADLRENIADFQYEENLAEEARKLLQRIRPELRMTVFNHFCTHCGDDNPKCECWNDE